MAGKTRFQLTTLRRTYECVVISRARQLTDGARQGDLARALDQDLSNCFKGDFAFYRTYQDAPNPGLFLPNDVGVIGLPLNPREAPAIVASCQRQPALTIQRDTGVEWQLQPWELPGSEVSGCYSGASMPGLTVTDARLVSYIQRGDSLRSASFTTSAPRSGSTRLSLNPAANFASCSSASLVPCECRSGVWLTSDSWIAYSLLPTRP